ncbi:hypothetical protein Tco_0503365, partial [Tanacetum coccineum]
MFYEGLYASDGEINLEKNDNLISNNYTVKFCLEYEVWKGKKLVKKELMVLLRREVYFVQFIINPKEDEFEPGLIFGRSFLRSANAMTKTDLPPMVCKMGKGSRNKKKIIENIMYFNDGVGPSSSVGTPLTQEEAERRALAYNISMRILTTFDGLTRQTFKAARSKKIIIAESDSDDEEDYVIKRNDMGTPIHNSRPIGY